MRKLIFNFFKINIDSENDTTKNKIKYFLFSKSDFNQFNFGPTAIANKKGTKKAPLSCNCYTVFLEEGIK